MAEEIKIIIGADVNQAINNVGKFNAKLGDTDDIVSDVIGSSKNLDDALDKLAKQGLLSINSLEQSIGDFKTAFSNATNPEDIKKFGDALVVLKKRQQDLINSGLPEHLDKVSHSSGGGVIATQRLSASVLGLSNHLGALPPELAGLTHGFDQLIQSFERITHGTEGAGDKVTKFAGVLGQVGLGLAISVAVGLLVDFVHGLLDSEHALEEVTAQGEKFKASIDDINKGIEDSKANLKFLQELGNINLDIAFGKGFKTDLLAANSGFIDLQTQALKLQDALKTATEANDEAFKEFQDKRTDEAQSLTAAYSSLAKVPESAIKGLGKVDQELIKNAQLTAKEVSKINDDILENQRQQELASRKTDQLKVDEGRKVNKDLQSLFDSRANIIKEFTAKFASIKDPFPDFFTKNLPLGKVEDKALRSALENSFKLLQTATQDILSHKIIASDIPVIPTFKIAQVGDSDLVKQIQEKFGDLSKEVADAVNKGIFTVPVDFKIAPEGDGQALQDFEKKRDDFLKSIESLTGQRRAILTISPEFLVNADETKKRDILEKLQEQIQAAASGVPLKVVMKGTADVQLVVDKDKIAVDLAHDINDAIQSGLRDVFTGLGDLIGDAISKGFDSDGAKEVLSAISGIIGNVGKALIKAGVALLGLQKVIDKLATNPALAIALDITLVALSRAFQNSISGAREKGGPVQGGLSYLVNERGREIFVPNNGTAEWIEGGPQLFKPKTSGKIISASFAKMFADRFQMPKFADGGLVSGPVFGLLGEGSSISSLNPEVIAPLETLKNLLPGFTGQSVDVRVTGSIHNRVIKLGQAREGRSNRRNS